MYKIFDIHAHVYPDAVAKKAIDNLSAFYEFKEKYNFLPSGKGTTDDLRDSSVSSGICGCLMLSVATNERQVGHINDFMAEAAQSMTTENFCALGFAGIHQDYADKASEVERIISLGLKGIKIHPDIQRVDIDDKRLMELYEIIEGKLPLYLHMGDPREEFSYSATEKLARVKKRFPKLEVIAAHMGGYTAWDKIGLVTDFEHMWFDTSSSTWVLSPKDSGEIIKALGYERVMFGTDYPVAYASEELERFMKIELDKKTRADILYNNAARFLELS